MINNSVTLQTAVAVSSFSAVWGAQKRLSDNPAWETTQGSAAGMSSLQHLLSRMEGVGCWHWLEHPSGRRAHGLPALPLQGTARDRTQLSFSQSCFLSPTPIPFSLSPCLLPRPPFLPFSHKSSTIAAEAV